MAERRITTVIVQVLSRNWWLLLIRGVLAICFAIAAFFLPGVAAFALVLAFGLWAGLDGIVAIVAAFGPNPHHRWVLILEGIVGIAAAVITFWHPFLVAFVLLLVIAWWAIITGILEIVAAVQLRKEISDEWWLIIAGLASILFGILMFMNPRAGALAVVWIVALYALIFGVVLIGLSMRLRKIGTRLPAT
jgi:uncharacterized membrane protein HdeD (DUF308 family)